jgi:SOS-response transcriptional repressor LexA
VNNQYNLSPKQYETWVKIAKYIREHRGRSPSVDDIMDETHSGSRSTTQSRIDKLKEHGLIDSEPRIPRSIVLLQSPPEEVLK